MAISIPNVNAQKVWVFAQNPDGTLSPATIGGGGGGTVTAVTGVSPITSTGGNTPIIGCATCTTNAAALTANALVIGGGAQATSALGSLGTTTTVLHGNATGAPTFGAVNLAADVSGQLPISAVGSAGLSGTSPITISAAGAIGCATCNTSAGSLTNNIVLKGAGTQGIQLSGITDDGTTVSTAEIFTLSRAGALSSSTVNITGAPVTGGSGTTTFPLVYINSGAAPTTFSANGTLIGLNSPTGFTGNFIDAHLNGGVSVFAVTSAGIVTCSGSLQPAAGIISSGNIVVAAGASYGFTGRSTLRSAADGRAALNNNANGTGGFTRLSFGTEAANNPAFSFDGTTAVVKTADGTGATTAGIFSSAIYRTDSNTASTASPAVCGASSAGMAQIAAVVSGAATIVVNTTAVTANSRILLTLSTVGLTAPTNVNLVTPPYVSAISAGVSFTVTVGTGPVTNPINVMFNIIN